MPIQYFSVTPTVTAGAYSVNDVVGGRLTFKGLRRGSLQTITISDKSAGGPDYLLVLFNDAPTDIADNATYDIADADLSKIIRTVDMNSAATQTTFNDNAIYNLAGLDIPLAAQCPSITAFLIATASAPTYASTSDITVTLQVDTDYVSGRNQGSSNINAIQSGDAAGGELAGTYPVPTVNATHSGSSHAALPAGVTVDGVAAVTISGSQTLTNKTIDADNSTISNLAHGAEVDEPSSGVHGATGSIVGTTDSQTLSNKTFSDDTVFQDNAAVALGTGGDARLYFNGVDTFLDLGAVGSGDLMIALADNFPASPDAGTVHIWKGTAGTIAPVADTILTLENSSHEYISFLTPNTSTQGLRFGDPEDADVGGMLYNHGANSIIFKAATANAVKITSVGLEVTGGSLSFPATQVASADANTLDDYEEGTWTPAVGGDATYGSLNEGHYTKIGRLVTISGRLQITTLGTGSARIMSGLPFTSQNVGGQHGGSCYFFTGLAEGVAWINPAVLDNSATLQFNKSTAITSTSTAAADIFGDGAAIDFTATYHAAA